MMQILLLLYGISLTLSISGAEIIGGLLLFVTFGPTLWKRKHLHWEKSPFDFPLLAYAVWMVFCVMASGSISLSEILSKMSALLLFVLVAHGLVRSDLKKILQGFWAGCVMAAIWGILSIDPKFGRAIGSRSHPLTYSETFIPIIFILFGLLGEKIIKNKEKLRLYWKETLSLGLILTALVLSQSRGVWLGVFFGFIVLLSSWPRKKAALLFLSFSLVGLTVFSISPELRKRALSIVSPASGSESDYQSSSTRLDLWAQSLQVLRGHPVRGFGYGGAQLKTLDPQTGENRMWTEAHNIYLQAGLDGGLVGLGVLMWILITTVFCIKKISGPKRMVCAAIFTTFVIAGLTESWTHDKEIAFLFWGFLGAIELLRRDERFRNEN